MSLSLILDVIHQVTMKKNKLVYIIPTYNERENIASMLTEVTRMLKTVKYDSSVLVVDDNSPDGTGKIVTRMMKNNRSIFLLNGTRFGLGIAMIRGYKYAIKNLRADVVVTNEADFSYSPSRVPLMLKLTENGADAVFGSRKANSKKRGLYSRIVIHWISNTLFAKYVAGVNQVNDHNSAFKIIKVKNILDSMDFDQFPKGYAFFNYLTHKVVKNTPNIVEVYNTYTPRSKGLSKISMNPKYLKYFLKDTLEYIVTCFKIRKERMH